MKIMLRSFFIFFFSFVILNFFSLKVFANVCLHPLEQAALLSGQSQDESLSAQIKRTKKILKKLGGEDGEEGEIGELLDVIEDQKDEIKNTLKEDPSWGNASAEKKDKIVEALFDYMAAQQDEWDQTVNGADFPWCASATSCSDTDKYFSRNGKIKAKAFCADYAEEREKKACRKGIEKLSKYNKYLNAREELYEEQLDILEALEDRDFDRSLGLSDEEDTEADGLCFECLDKLRELDEPTTGQTVGNILSVVAGGALSYYGYKAGRRQGDRTDDLRARQGYEPLGSSGLSFAGASLGLPFISNGIYGLSGGNSRFGSFACGPSFAGGSAGLYSPFGHYGSGAHGHLGAYGGLGLPGAGAYGHPGVGLGGGYGFPGAGLGAGFQIGGGYGFPGAGLGGGYGLPGAGLYGPGAGLGAGFQMGGGYGLPGAGLGGGYGFPGAGLYGPGAGLGAGFQIGGGYGFPGAGLGGGYGLPGAGLYGPGAGLGAGFQMGGGYGLPGAGLGAGLYGLPGAGLGAGLYGLPGAGLGAGLYGLPGAGLGAGYGVPRVNLQAQYQQQQYNQYLQFQQSQRQAQMQAQMAAQQAWAQHQQSIQQDWMQRQQTIGTLTQELHNIQQQIQLVASGGLGSTALGASGASLATGVNVGTSAAGGGNAPTVQQSLHDPNAGNSDGELPVIEER